MSSDTRYPELVRAGDVSGRGRIYDASGILVRLPGESLLQVVDNWDMDVISPWRRVLPNVVFAGLNGKATSKLFVSDQRIVLVRHVDSWREVKGEMTPLGMPNAIAKKSRLDYLRNSGVFQFCEIRPSSLRIVTSKARTSPNSWLSLRLIGADGVKYAIMIWKTDGVDAQTLSLVEAQFAR